MYRDDMLHEGTRRYLAATWGLMSREDPKARQPSTTRGECVVVHYFEMSSYLGWRQTADILAAVAYTALWCFWRQPQAMSGIMASRVLLQDAKFGCSL